MQLEQLQTRLTSQGIQLVMTEAAEVYLAQRGYDPVFGARPMKRTLQRDVQDPIAIRLLDGELRSGMTIQLDASQNKLHFKIRKHELRLRICQTLNSKTRKQAAACGRAV